MGNEDRDDTGGTRGGIRSGTVWVGRGVRGTRGRGGRLGSLSERLTTPEIQTQG